MAFSKENELFDFDEFLLLGLSPEESDMIKVPLLVQDMATQGWVQPL